MAVGTGNDDEVEVKKNLQNKMEEGSKRKACRHPLRHYGMLLRMNENTQPCKSMKWFFQFPKGAKKF